MGRTPPSTKVPLPHRCRRHLGKDQRATRQAPHAARQMCCKKAAPSRLMGLRPTHWGAKKKRQHQQQQQREKRLAEGSGPASSSPTAGRPFLRCPLQLRKEAGREAKRLFGSGHGAAARPPMKIHHSLGRTTMRAAPSPQPPRAGAARLGERLRQPPLASPTRLVAQ